MAGIYIRGLQMPKEGEIVCIDIHPDRRVSINLDLTCRQIATAFQVPDHGELIDRQELEIKMKTRSWYIGRASDPDCVVADAPTIIPADKEVDK